MLYTVNMYDVCQFYPNKTGKKYLFTKSHILWALGFILERCTRQTPLSSLSFPWSGCLVYSDSRKDLIDKIHAYDSAVSEYKVVGLTSLCPAVCFPKRLVCLFFFN